MNDWIAWLNQNQGATMVLLTVVYVIATVRVCVLMKRSNRLASEALERSTGYQKETTRPYVVFDLEEREEDILVAVLSNIGARPAIDIEVKIDPPLKKLEREDKRILTESPYVPCTLTTNKVAFLAPGRELYDHIEHLSRFLRENKDTVYKVEVSYSDSRGERYEEKNEMNFGFYWNRLTIGTRERSHRVSRSGSAKFVR